MAIYMCTYGYMPLWQHSWLFGSAATWPYGVTGIKLYAYVCVQGYMARWLCSYMVIWIHGCMAILLHGCMVVWLRGYMHMYDYVATRLNGTWLYTYMTIWLYNYMAQSCMRWGERMGGGWRACGVMGDLGWFHLISNMYPHSTCIWNSMMHGPMRLVAPGDQIGPVGPNKKSQAPIKSFAVGLKNIVNLDTMGPYKKISKSNGLYSLWCRRFRWMARLQYSAWATDSHFWPDPLVFHIPWQAANMFFLQSCCLRWDLEQNLVSAPFGLNSILVKILKSKTKTKLLAQNLYTLSNRTKTVM